MPTAPKELIINQRLSFSDASPALRQRVDFGLRGKCQPPILVSCRCSRNPRMCQALAVIAIRGNYLPATTEHLILE
jgi:hypothetical protein